MTLRHLAPAPLLAVAIFACTPSVPSNPYTEIVTAEFDPATGTIPLPNSLAINPALNPALLAPRNAQEELLAYFAKQGGFPPDQVLSLGFPVATLTVNGPNDVTSAAPDIDMASIVPCTGAQAPGNCNFFVFDALAPADQQFPAFATAYTKGATSGSLTATPGTASAPNTWRPGGLLFYALRGGASGIKTKTAVPLQPSSTTYTLIFGQPGDFTCPSTSPDCALQSLKILQAQYQPVFATIQNKGFPLDEVVVVGTFSVAPATTWVVADPGAGVVPIPSNFLLDPLTNRVSAAVDALLGLPMSSLDGFSTTAMDIAQTRSYSASHRASESSPISAGSVRASTGKGVFVYKAGATTATEVTGIYAQPPPITLDMSTGQPCTPVNAQGDYGPTCVSTIIGIQPALTVPTPLGPLVLPPYEEKTDYAVIVTNKVTDPGGLPLSNTTLGQMLLFTHPLCTPSPTCAATPTTATSQIPGVSGPLASLLESMRLRLKPVVSQLATDHGIAAADIVMPYVFRTQSISGEALQLGAAPYVKAPGTTTDYFPPAPVNAVARTSEQMALRWGVDPALLSTSAISKFVEADVLTFDKLDPNTGAFNPVPAAGALTPVPAILALPATPPPTSGWPLVVFHHGLGRSRGDMLFIAQSLASGGLAVVAIDSAKHGSRAWCTKNTVTGVSSGCAAGATCDAAVFAQQQGDPPTARPGLCTSPGLQLVPIGCNPSLQPGCWTGEEGNSTASGSFEISANLFRSRDTVRQDILDHSMVTRVMTSQAGQAALAQAAGTPFLLDATKVYYVGQSMGSVEGTVDLAANPRISKAVLNVGGATISDILTTPQSVVGQQFLATLAEIGVVPGTEEFLLFTIAAKWILDPADPANFAQNLVTSPLPNLLVDPTGQTAQDPKAVFAQAARCDNVVPNFTNQLLYGLIGLHPIALLSSDTAPTLQWFMTSPAAGDCPIGAVTHGFLLDWTNPGAAATAQENVVRYLLDDPTKPIFPSPVIVPAAP